MWIYEGDKDCVDHVPLACKDAVAILYMFDLTSRCTLSKYEIYSIQSDFSLFFINLNLYRPLEMLASEILNILLIMTIIVHFNINLKLLFVFSFPFFSFSVKDWYIRARKWNKVYYSLLFYFLLYTFTKYIKEHYQQIFFYLLADSYSNLDWVEI